MIRVIPEKNFVEYYHSISLLLELPNLSQIISIPFSKLLFFLCFSFGCLDLPSSSGSSGFSFESKNMFITSLEYYEYISSKSK